MRKKNKNISKHIQVELWSRTCVLIENINYREKFPRHVNAKESMIGLVQ